MTFDSPRVMGILNTTPDSFFDGGRYVDEKTIIERADKMIADGADFIDVGGYSSRPGADDITPEDEIRRVVDCIRSIRNVYPNIPISIDTFRARVAEEALKAGANLINDISGGQLDPSMFNLVAEAQVPYILMHMRGTPQNMTSHVLYENLLRDILVFFEKKMSELHGLGVKDIVVDPGFGFAKTLEQNYELLKNLEYFKVLELPLLAGVSRKSFIYKKLGVSSTEALNGTTVLNTIALMNGARILRVHDVKEAVETVKLYNSTYKD